MIGNRWVRLGLLVLILLWLGSIAFMAEWLSGHVVPVSGACLDAGGASFPVLTRCYLCAGRFIYRWGIFGVIPLALVVMLPRVRLARAALLILALATGLFQIAGAWATAQCSRTGVDCLSVLLEQRSGRR